MTSSNGSIFRVIGHLCGKFTGHREFPAKRPVTWSFDVFFDLSLNKRLSKQSWDWSFETPPRPSWRHCNETWTKFDRENILEQVDYCHDYVCFNLSHTQRNTFSDFNGKNHFGFTPSVFQKYCLKGVKMVFSWRKILKRYYFSYDIYCTLNTLSIHKNTTWACCWQFLSQSCIGWSDNNGSWRGQKARIKILSGIKFWLASHLI